MTQLTVLLQVPAAGNQWMNLMLPILLLGIFYFFMIRPQMKRQKEIRNFRESLKQGDKVVTTGGIYGKITDIKDNQVTLEIAPNVRVRVDKSAILQTMADAPQK